MTGDPVVYIEDSGSTNAFSVNYTLTCIVTVDVGLPNVSWFDFDGNEIQNNSNTVLVYSNDGLNTSLELQFSLLQYSAAGVYTCQTELLVEDHIFNSSQMYTVNVQSKYMYYTCICIHVHVHVYLSLIV